MATLDFNVDKIMKQVVTDALAHAEKKFTQDISRLGAPYGERPQISFTRKGDSLDVKFEVKSPELHKKIDAYLRDSK